MLQLQQRVKPQQPEKLEEPNNNRAVSTTSKPTKPNGKNAMSNSKTEGTNTCTGDVAFSLTAHTDPDHSPSNAGSIVGLFKGTISDLVQRTAQLVDDGSEVELLREAEAGRLGGNLTLVSTHATARKPEVRAQAVEYAEIPPGHKAISDLHTQTHAVRPMQRKPTEPTVQQLQPGETLLVAANGESKVMAAKSEARQGRIRTANTGKVALPADKRKHLLENVMPILLLNGFIDENGRPTEQQARGNTQTLYAINTNGGCTSGGTGVAFHKFRRYKLTSEDKGNTRTRMCSSYAQLNDKGHIVTPLNPEDLTNYTDEELLTLTNNAKQNKLPRLDEERELRSRPLNKILMNRSCEQTANFMDALTPMITELGEQYQSQPWFKDDGDKIDNQCPIVDAAFVGRYADWEAYVAELANWPHKEKIVVFEATGHPIDDTDPPAADVRVSGKLIGVDFRAFGTNYSDVSMNVVITEVDGPSSRLLMRLSVILYMGKAQSQSLRLRQHFPEWQAWHISETTSHLVHGRMLSKGQGAKFYTGYGYRGGKIYKPNPSLSAYKDYEDRNKDFNMTEHFQKGALRVMTGGDDAFCDAVRRLHVQCMLKAAGIGSKKHVLNMPPLEFWCNDMTVHILMELRKDKQQLLPQVKANTLVAYAQQQRTPLVALEQQDDAGNYKATSNDGLGSTAKKLQRQAGLSLAQALTTAGADGDLPEGVPSNENAFLDATADYLVGLLHPLHGERMLVDLELGTVGPKSPICKKFWRETAAQWIPGDSAFDRSTIELNKDMPVLMATWAQTQRLALDTLTAATVQQLSDVQVWQNLQDTPSLFQQPSALKDECRRLRQEAKLPLPQSVEQLRQLLNVELPDGDVPFSKAKQIKTAEQLRKAVCTIVPTDKVEATMADLRRLEAKRFDRLRFQNHLPDGMLKEGGMLDSLQTLEPTKADQLLDAKQCPSPAEFCPAFQAAIHGVGPLASLKVAGALQYLGHLSKDSVPALGKEEGAFCCVRAAMHNVLTGQTSGPTWLKKAPMDELKYPMPTQDQVAKVISKMQKARWTTQATAWWQGRMMQRDGAAKHNAAMHHTYLPWRLALQIEAMLCEVGNRQRRAIAYAQDKSVGGTKCEWRASGTRKDLTSMTLLSLDADGVSVRRETNVDIVSLAASSDGGRCGGGTSGGTRRAPTNAPQHREARASKTRHGRKA